jgi:hypothetical protein
MIQLEELMIGNIIFAEDESLHMTTEGKILLIDSKNGLGAVGKCKAGNSWL